MAYIHADYDSLDLAEKLIYKAIDLHQNSPTADSISILISYNNLGLINIYKENYTEAIKAHEKVLNSTLDTTKIKQLSIKRTAFSNISYIYKQLKNYKIAIEYGDKGDRLYDKIQELKKASEIRFIEANFNTEKIKKEEALKTLKVTQEKEKLEKRIIYLVFTFITIILFGILIYRNSLLKQGNLSLKIANQELENQKKINALEKQLQGKIINATLDGREKERKDIAQTLHDSVSALLSSANMHLQVIKRKSNENIIEIEKSQQIINEASDKIRDLSHQLISVILMKFGLNEAVKDLEKNIVMINYNLLLKPIT